ARFMLEMEADTEAARPLLQDRQQPLAADADEAVAGRADRLAVNVDLDIVPMGEFALDDRARDRIVRDQILDRLVGEDDAPAERVVGAVALEEVDLLRGVAQLHRNRESEPGGPAAQASDPHRRLLWRRGKAVAGGRQLPSVIPAFAGMTEEVESDYSGRVQSGDRA